MLIFSWNILFAGSAEEEPLASLEAAFAAAESGRKGVLDYYAGIAGDGGWYVLALIAEERGYLLSRDFSLQRSVAEDPHPFSTAALVLLLRDSPESLGRPLPALKRVERDYPDFPGIRAARIAVLDSRGRDRALLDELERIDGTAADAAVLAAAIRRNPDDIRIQAMVDRFILHVDDPAVLDRLPGNAIQAVAEGTFRLYEARLAFAGGFWNRALEGYRAWIESSLDSGAACELEEPPELFGEIARSAEAAERQEEWADYLVLVADGFGGPKRFGALFQAGKLYRSRNRFADAAEAFRAAARSMPAGLQRDRALWYLLRVSYQQNYFSRAEELETWEMVRSSWDSPERFDDQLDMYVHRRVYGGDWDLLSRDFTDRGELWPDPIRAQTALILAFAASEGRLSDSGRDIGSYLEIALETDPFSWASLRAAGILGRMPPLPQEKPVSAVETGPSLSDLAIPLMLNLGLDLEAYDALLARPFDYSPETIRLVSRSLAKTDPRKSIHIAGLLRYGEDYYPTRADLLLRYPLPLGDMAAEYARKEGIPPEIFHGLIRTESAWDAEAVSRSGATGLSQFMPATWAEWVRRMDFPEDTDPTDAEANAALGAAYLDWLLEREWTWGWVDTLASYNAGGGRVRSWRRERPGLGDDLFGESIPVEEPRTYVRKVLSAATLYGYLYSGRTPAELHRSWGLEMIEVD